MTHIATIVSIELWAWNPHGESQISDLHYHGGTSAAPTYQQILGDHLQLCPSGTSGPRKTLWTANSTIWLFNIAMENHHF